MNTQLKPSAEEAAIERRFGFRPGWIGLRPRGWWINLEPTEEDILHGVQAGDLMVLTCDAGIKSEDEEAKRLPNFRTTIVDKFDPTYLHYVFKPLEGSE